MVGSTPRDVGLSTRISPLHLDKILVLIDLPRKLRTCLVGAFGRLKKLARRRQRGWLETAEAQLPLALVPMGHTRPIRRRPRQFRWCQHLVRLPRLPFRGRSDGLHLLLLAVVVLDL